MKKLLILLAFISFSADMEAGWNTDTRSKCRTFRKKYVARASVFTGLYAYQRDAGCGYAYAEKIKNCAWQKTSNSSSGAWQQGGVNNSFCSRGEVITPFENFLLPNLNLSSSQNLEESNFKSNDVIFDELNHKIILSGITGFIKLQKGKGYYSNLRLAVWKPSDDLVNEIEDEKMDDNEILNHFEIRVTDKGVFFNGTLVSDALKNQFIISDFNNELYVKFDNVSIEIPIQNNISLDDLAVRFEGDGAPNTRDNLNNAINNTTSSTLDNIFKFNTYPNPSMSVLNIEFANNITDGNALIELYNSNGDKVIDVFNGNLLKEESKNIEVDLSNLIDGSYYILIDSNGEKLVKQIVKQ